MTAPVSAATPAAPAASGSSDNKPKEPDKDDKGTPADPDWKGAVERIRTTASWVTKAFVAVAALLVGSGPLLVNLGDLTWSPRGVVAVVGAVLALAGAFAVIFKTSEVMLPETSDIAEVMQATSGPLKDLRVKKLASTEGQSIYLLGRPSLAALQEVRAVAVGEANATALVPDSPAGKIARSWLDAISERYRLMASPAIYTEVRARFVQARLWMFVGATAVAIGTGMYLGALKIDPPGEKKAEGSDAASPSSDVQLLTWLSKDDAPAVDRLRDALGLADRACDEVGVQVHGGKGSTVDPWDVSVLPDSDCKVRMAQSPPPSTTAGAPATGPVVARSVRFSVDSRYASLGKFEPIKVPVPGIPPENKKKDAEGAVATVAVVIASLAIIAVIVLLRRGHSP